MSGEINAYLIQIEDYFKELRRHVWLQDDTYRQLLTRYDDAMKRIQDLQAEIEALKIIHRDAN